MLRNVQVVGVIKIRQDEKLLYSYLHAVETYRISEYPLARIGSCLFVSHTEEGAKHDL